MTIGPEIVAFGAARADGYPVPAIGQQENGYPVFVRRGRGFIIYLEARRGVSRLPVGTVTFDSNPGDANVLPDLQLVVSRPLGNGSTAVCDDGPLPLPLGGVPATDPPQFGGSQAASNAINDFTCRFDVRVASSQACTRNDFGVEVFTTGLADVQFCSSPGIGTETAFPEGDTIVTGRVRDIAGNPGPAKSIVIRVEE
ncbi:MAG: hypothetical protein AB7V27_04610 [Candidatus Binatia bacterium]